MIGILLFVMAILFGCHGAVEGFTALNIAGFVLAEIGLIIYLIRTICYGGLDDSAVVDDRFLAHASNG